MNMHNWNTLSWGKLMNPSMTGKDILIVQYNERPYSMDTEVVKIIGTGYAGPNHVLVVEKEGDDDVYIITKEFKGSRWEAYEMLEGF